ncbi:RepB family plasmid replication initiator protein [Campylobacter anatolicus]|uniref:RepB family plasmid replication initiator protein n=1 Tax=Campylobacter anatolicus TaxID=2829105 RepID=UPI002D21D2C0|nr:RepB family plasmid replication initiator protein [Campylobacter anatolicus]
MRIFRNKQSLSFKLNPLALDILFSTFKFMRININDFVSIRGKFAKTLYRLLSSTRTLSLIKMALNV